MPIYQGVEDPIKTGIQKIFLLSASTLTNTNIVIYFELNNVS